MLWLTRRTGESGWGRGRVFSHHTFHMQGGCPVQCVPKHTISALPGLACHGCFIGAWFMNFVSPDCGFSCEQASKAGTPPIPPWGVP